MDKKNVFKKLNTAKTKTLPVNTKNNTRRRNLDNNGVFWYKMTITQKANFWKKELILLLVSKKKVKFKKDLYLKVPNSIYHCPPLKTIILYDQMKKKKLMNNFYEFVKQAKKIGL